MSYLFHVEHAGEHASVEVGEDGRVRQAFGPRNQCNDAAQWGAQALSRCGSQFPRLATLGVPLLDALEAPVSRVASYDPAFPRSGIELPPGQTYRGNSVSRLGRALQRTGMPWNTIGSVTRSPGMPFQRTGMPWNTISLHAV